MVTLTGATGGSAWRGMSCFQRRKKDSRNFITHPCSTTRFAHPGPGLGHFQESRRSASRAARRSGGSRHSCEPGGALWHNRSCANFWIASAELKCPCPADHMAAGPITPGRAARTIWPEPGVCSPWLGPRVALRRGDRGRSRASRSHATGGASLRRLGSSSSRRSCPRSRRSGSPAVHPDLPDDDRVATRDARLLAWSLPSLPTLGGDYL